MSTRADLRAWLGQEAADHHERACAVCGGAWSALWVGLTELAVCRRCALEVLPRVIADACWHPHLTAAEAERVTADVRAEFWRAIAIQALRARDRGGV